MMPFDMSPLAMLFMAAVGGFLGLILALVLWAFIPAGGWLLMPPAIGGVVGFIIGGRMA